MMFFSKKCAASPQCALELLHDALYNDTAAVFEVRDPVIQNQRLSVIAAGRGSITLGA